MSGFTLALLNALGVGRLGLHVVAFNLLMECRIVWAFSLTGSESETLDGSASWGRFVQGFVNLTGSAAFRS